MSAGDRVGENVVIFSGLLEIPGQAAHEKPRIARYEVDIVDASCLVAQTRFKEERRLFPFRVENVLNEQEGF